MLYCTVEKKCMQNSISKQTPLNKCDTRSCWEQGFLLNNFNVNGGTPGDL